MSHAYSCTTRKITVGVEPFYIDAQSDPEARRWVFGYAVTITNEGDAPVQLMSRHWKITDGLGRVFEVRGDGVIGEQPCIQPGGCYSYTSGTPLPTSSGSMAGTYQMIDEAGLWFDVEIPAFSLDAPGVRGTIN